MATNDNPKPAAAGMPAAERHYSDLYPLRPCLDYEEKCHQADLLGRSILQPMVNATKDELRRLGLPTDLDQLDPWVAWHDPETKWPKFQTKDGQPNPSVVKPPPKSNARAYRNHARGKDASDALLVLRQLKTAIRQEDVYAAVRHMATFARLSEGFLTDARRGQRIIEAAGEGGKSRARAVQHPQQQWQALASELWKRHPSWSKSQVARHIGKETRDNPDTIRRSIKKPPDTS